jgi:hypothetical protein
MTNSTSERIILPGIILPFRELGRIMNDRMIYTFTVFMQSILHLVISSAISYQTSEIETHSASTLGCTTLAMHLSPPVAG